MDRHFDKDEVHQKLTTIMRIKDIDRKILAARIGIGHKTLDYCMDVGNKSVPFKKTMERVLDYIKMNNLKETDENS